VPPSRRPLRGPPHRLVRVCLYGYAGSKPSTLDYVNPLCAPLFPPGICAVIRRGAFDPIADGDELKTPSATTMTKAERLLLDLVILLLKQQAKGNELTELPMIVYLLVMTMKPTEGRFKDAGDITHYLKSFDKISRLMLLKHRLDSRKANQASHTQSTGDEEDAQQTLINDCLVEGPNNNTMDWVIQKARHSWESQATLSQSGLHHRVQQTCHQRAAPKAVA
jgi:hypothetical protein